MPNPYDELGVPRGAGHDDIKRAYKQLVRACHPDVDPSPAARVRFERVRVAWEILSDTTRRHHYDRYGEESLQPGFDPVYAERLRQADAPQAPSDSQFGDMSAFARAFQGAFQDDPFPTPGAAPQTPSGPPTVEVAALLTFLGGRMSASVRTRGYGRAETIDLHIPAGTHHGDRLVGHAGHNGVEVVVRVVDHPHVRREGDDLHMDLPITLREALVGGPIEVPTPTGPARIRLPSQCMERKIRLKGRGVQRRSQPGHLILHLKPQLPTRLTPEVERALELLDAAGDLDPRRRISFD